MWSWNFASFVRFKLRVLIKNDTIQNWLSITFNIAWRFTAKWVNKAGEKSPQNYVSSLLKQTETDFYFWWVTIFEALVFAFFEKKNARKFEKLF